MESFELYMTVLIYILVTVLLIAIIALVIKLIKTLTKVDKVVDDINYKSSKLNGVFSLIDTATSAIETVNDKLAGTILKGISSLFSRKKKGDDKDE